MVRRSRTPDPQVHDQAESAGGLDDLARTLAQEMPRRRALRVIAGAVAAAAMPAWLARPAAAGRKPLKHTCDIEVAERGWQYCTPATEACFPTCCPGDWKCSVGPLGSNGCPSVTVCCNPCDPLKSQVLPGGNCGPGPVAEHCCPGNRKCGSKCCDVGSVCADPDLEFCCEPRELACRGGGTVSCCKPGVACCAGRCCAPGQRCYQGRCRNRCPQGTRRCGHNCCGKFQTCCDGTCCTRNQKCCFGDHCCAKTKTCCGQGCCNPGAKCCGNHCCAGTASCCGTGCCPANQTCVTTAGQKTCCPNAQVARVGGAAVCCPAGDVAVGDRCCPAANPSCRTCDPPCPAGHVCRDGFCLQV